MDPICDEFVKSGKKQEGSVYNVITSKDIYIGVQTRVQKTL